MPENIAYPLTPVQRLIRLLGQYRREIRYIILYAVVVGLINLSLPLGTQAIIGQIAGGGINASWGVLTLLVIVGALLVGILRLMQLSLMEYMQRHIFTDASLEFAIRLPRLHLEQLRREHLPELVNRFFDTITLQKGLPKLLIEGSNAILQIILSLLVLSLYHPSFITASVLLLGLLAVFFYWTAPQGIQSSLQESKYKYQLAYWLEEVGRVAATFKLAGNNRLPLTRADELTVSYLKARSRHWRILVGQFFGSVLFRVLALSGFLILGSILVVENQLNIGQFVAAEILIFYVIESVEKLILLHETGYDVLTATEKIGQVADLPLERSNGIRVEEFSVSGPLAVELRDLSYQYEDSEAPVLKNLNLVINAGERLAIVGYNRSGKSTLMQLLSVLRLNFTGALLFNGLPKPSLHLGSLRDHIGDLSSQEDIFRGSLRENIALGREQATLQKVLQVIEAVGLGDFMRHESQGLELQLQPGGKNVPRSIVTKILVARAIVTEPKLLSLEEPMGNLNFRDRLRIARYLTDRSHPWTLISVTEDPLLASMCDRILVMQAGTIVFDGSFDEVQKTRHYERIFRTNIENSTWNDESVQ